MAKISNPEDLKIGHWYTFCCEEDLTEITSEDQLKDARADLEDCIGDAWETKEEALTEIDLWWAGNRPSWVKTKPS